MRSLWLTLLVLGCEVPKAPVAAPLPPSTNSVSGEDGHADSCNHEIPDCEAACALREVHRAEHLEWFDRRCAAVILGKNPDKATAYVPPSWSEPTDTNDTTGASPSTAPTSRQLPAFDPFASRGTTPEPAECEAARSLRARGKDRDADMLAALCSAKGGTERRPGAGL